jgi:hypothetical protein
LLEALQQAQRDKQRALKIVHGYGSSGTGGKLRDGIRKSLNLRRKEGKIVGFCPGEKWGPFDEATQALLEKYPDLKRDSDYGKGNYGITVVLVA